MDKVRKVLCIVTFVAGTYIVLNGGKQILEEWCPGIYQGLSDFAESRYALNLSYINEEKKVSLKEWVADKAMQVLPLGTYVEGKAYYQTASQDEDTYEKILKQQSESENEVGADGKLVKENNQPVQEKPAVSPKSNVDLSIEKLRDFDYLIKNFYTVDSTTMIGPEQLNVDDLLGRNMKIDMSKNGPKILIFHTHSQESFADSDGTPATSIVGIGKYLQEQLEKKGIPTMHHDGVYDLVDGKLDRSSAYELCEAEVRKILKANPSIEVVIDLHRDGVNENTHLVTQVNGKPTAKIMYFNGLSRTKANGDIPYLKNPYIQDNLAMSLQMQIASETYYPEFARHIYLKGYRYNLHLKPKSLMVEAGAQTNTVQEMKNAMDVLADLLYRVLVE